MGLHGPGVTPTWFGKNRHPKGLNLKGGDWQVETTGRRTGPPEGGPPAAKKRAQKNANDGASMRLRSNGVSIPAADFAATN